MMRQVAYCPGIAQCITVGLPINCIGASATLNLASVIAWRAARAPKNLDGNLVLQNVPTPTASGIELRRAQFSTLVEALDYAACGLSGFNYYNGRGDLTTVLPYSELRERARALARRLQGLGRGARGPYKPRRTGRRGIGR